MCCEAPLRLCVEYRPSPIRRRSLLLNLNHYWKDVPKGTEIPFL